MEPPIPNPSENNLQLHKENAELRELVDILRGDVKDRDAELVGLKKTIEECRDQLDKFATTLGVRNDYATLIGEVKKLIIVEDDIEILRKQIRTLKGDDGGAIGQVIADAEKTVHKMKQKVVDLNQEISQLRARRNVDKYKSMELIKEAMKRFGKSVINILTLRFLFSRIKGVKKSGN